MRDVDLVKEKIDIVEFIGEHIGLKKAGRNFKALCPFHSEKTPSFVVSPERQIWHCFGCQKGGDVIAFLMEIDRLEFPEALNLLADRVGVKLDSREFTTDRSRKRERLFALHQLATEYYHFILTKHATGAPGRQYLKERGITDKLIETFYLGYAPSAWENLFRYISKKGYSRQEAEDSGLVISGKSGCYDRFRGRVMFPLKNHRGQTLAFSGRLLQSDAKAAKYINSPETPLYTKGETVYGLDVTKEAIKRVSSVVVVEGEFDMISSFHAGVANVVAIKGSALTEVQVRLLKRYGERMVLALDADSAGDAAARRGIELAGNTGFDIRVVEYGQGKDPDEIARSHPHKWQQAVSLAVPYYDFLIKSAINRYGKGEAYNKKKITDELLPIFKRITNPVVQAHYIKELADQIDVSEETLTEALKTIKTTPVGRRQLVAGSTEQKQTRYPAILEEHLLAVVLQSKDTQKTLVLVLEAEVVEKMHDSVVKRIFQKLYALYQEKKQLDINVIAKTLPVELVPTLDRLYLAELSPFESQGEYEKETKSTIKSLKQYYLKQQLSALSKQLAVAEKNGESKQVAKLTQQIQAHTKSLQEVVKQV